MSRVLIRGGCVLTLGERSKNHPIADVLIEHDRIAEVGTGLRARDADLIDATDCIVMPGFVDAHRHTSMALLRNLGSSSGGVDETDFEPDDLYAGTLIGLLSALEAGITTVVDWPGVEGAPQIDAVRQAHADAGVRTVLVHAAATGTEGRSPTGTAAYASADVTPERAEELAARWRAARDSGVRIHAHAGLDPADAGVIADLGRRGALGSDVTLVHCTHLSGEDLDAVASSGASVVVAPSSEMAGGLGAPPLQAFLDRKISPGLAVDDERLAPGDMLAQMRAANSVQHAAYFDLKLAGKAGLPNLLTTRDMILYATRFGAEAVGLGAVTGSLEPGLQADVIVLRTDRPNIFPINDPIGAVVWGMDSSNLDTVLVGGRVLMREGELQADVDRARDLAILARDRVMAASGQLSGSGSQQ